MSSKIPFFKPFDQQDHSYFSLQRKRELDPSFAPIEKKDRTKAISKLPEISLQSIFTFAGFNPALVSRVCKSFNAAQKKNYRQVLINWLKEPHVASFFSGLTVESIKSLGTEMKIAMVKKIYSKILLSAREVGIVPSAKESNKHRSILRNLSSIAKEVQKIRNIDFLIFSHCALKKYDGFDSLSLFKGPNTSIANSPAALRQDLNKLSTTLLAEKAAAIRLWMEGHPKLLSTIKELNLSYHQLRSTPPEISLCSNLQTVDLSGNKLRKLPASFCALKGLSWLGLSSNQFTSFPPAIYKLKNLHSLYFCKNKVKELPSQIADLTHLKHLFLTKNQIARLPLQFNHLKLDQLSLEKNQLKSIDPISNPSTIAILKTDDNPFSFPSLVVTTLLNTLATRDHRIKHSYCKAVKKLLSKAHKAKGNMPIQDQFTLLAEKVSNRVLRKSLEEVLLLVSITTLNKMLQSSKLQHILLYSKDLPSAICHRIYAFTYLLEKKKGTKVDTPHFGRLAFTNTGQKVSHPSIRLKAIQLALLEVVIRLAKSHCNREIPMDALEKFDQFDASFKKKIYHHLYHIEKEAGRAKNVPNFGELAFRKWEGYDAPDESRILAVENLLNEIHNSAQNSSKK